MMEKIRTLNFTSNRISEFFPTWLLSVLPGTSLIFLVLIYLLALFGYKQSLISSRVLLLVAYPSSTLISFPVGLGYCASTETSFSYRYGSGRSSATPAGNVKYPRHLWC